MLKDYLEEKKLSMYKVSKDGGIPYSTLNDLVNGRVEIENCKVSLLLQLASYLNLSLDEVYAVTNSNGTEVKHTPAEISTSEQLTKSELQAPANDSDTVSPTIKTLPDFESLLHERLAPGQYIAVSADNKESMLQLMISTDRKEGENDFDYLRRICKKGGMSEDAFKKGLAYIIMTDYILAQQSRSLENVFIEKNPDGSLKRFILPKPTGDVLFLNKSPRGDDVSNQDITFLKKKERKLLKLVADKSVIDSEQIPSAGTIENILKNTNIPDKRIKKILGWYKLRTETLRIWLGE